MNKKIALFLCCIGGIISAADQDLAPYQAGLNQAIEHMPADRVGEHLIPLLDANGDPNALSDETVSALAAAANAVLLQDLGRRGLDLSRAGGVNPYQYWSAACEGQHWGNLQGLVDCRIEPPIDGEDQSLARVLYTADVPALKAYLALQRPDGTPVIDINRVSISDTSSLLELLVGFTNGREAIAGEDIPSSRYIDTALSLLRSGYRAKNRDRSEQEGIALLSAMVRAQNEGGEFCYSDEQIQEVMKAHNISPVYNGLTGLQHHNQTTCAGARRDDLEGDDGQEDITECFVLISPVDAALQMDRLGLLRMFAAEDARPRGAVTRDGGNAFFRAIAQGNKGAVRLFCEIESQGRQYRDIDGSVNRRGDSIFTMALRTPKMWDIVYPYLPADALYQDYGGAAKNKLVNVAVDCYQYPAVLALCGREEGVVNCTNAQGQAPLHQLALQVAQGNGEALATFEALAARKDADVNLPDINGVTPYALVYCCGDQKAAQALRATGKVDFDLQYEAFGSNDTLAMWALRQGKRDVGVGCIQGQKRFDHQDGDGRSIFHHVVELRDGNEVLDVVLERARRASIPVASMNELDTAGETAVSLAARKEDQYAFQALLNRGGNSNIVLGDGHTLFTRAVFEGDARAMRAYFEHSQDAVKPNVNAVLPGGDHIPLVVYAWDKYEEARNGTDESEAQKWGGIFERLVKQKADIRASGRLGSMKLGQRALAEAAKITAARDEPAAAWFARKMSLRADLSRFKAGLSKQRQRELGQRDSTSSSSDSEEDDNRVEQPSTERSHTAPAVVGERPSALAEAMRRHRERKSQLRSRGNGSTGNHSASTAAVRRDKTTDTGAAAAGNSATEGQPPRVPDRMTRRGSRGEQDEQYDGARDRDPAGLTQAELLQFAIGGTTSERQAQSSSARAAQEENSDDDEAPLPPKRVSKEQKEGNTDGE